MTKQILKCPKCNKYTMEKFCDVCSSECLTVRPAKYSPEDKYSHYRLDYKKKTQTL